MSIALSTASKPAPTVAISSTPSARAPIAPDLRQPDTEWPEPGNGHTLVPEGTPGKPVPPTAGSWTFSAVGDYGNGSKEQAKIAANILAKKPDALLTLGDNTYELALERDWRNKFDPDEFYGKIHREIPMYPSLGNHDVMVSPAPYFKRFPQLDGARFYSFSNKDVHFAALDTNESLKPGSPQHEWLKKDLAQATEGWKVLYMHHPMLSSASDRSEKLNIRANLAPLLAEHGVNLVLSGHDHNYERAKPFDNAAGTLFVRAGTGGKGNDGFDFSQPAWSEYRESAFGHLDVEVTGDKLVGRFVQQDGTVGDTWTVAKPAAPAAPAPVPAAEPAEAGAVITA